MSQSMLKEFGFPCLCKHPISLLNIELPYATYHLYTMNQYISKSLVVLHLKLDIEITAYIYPDIDLFYF